MKLISGIAIASLFWFLLFFEGWEVSSVLHNRYFWYGMSAATLLLTCYSFAADKEGMKKIFMIKRIHIPAGLLHGVVLYFISRLGVFLLSAFFPETKGLIESVYATRHQLPAFVIVMLLLFLIAPAEEIFWRGFVQRKISGKLGPGKALAITTVLYSAVHVWALNPLLMLAALVLGVHWGYMYKRFGSIIPGLVSHSLWDILIFVVFPVQL